MNKIDFSSPAARAQFFLDHFETMTYKEIAITFGWAKNDDNDEIIQKSVSRVKNLRRSLERKFSEEGLKIQKRDDLSTVGKNEIIIPNNLKNNLVKAPLETSSHQGVLKKGYSSHNFNIKNDYYTKIKVLQEKSGKTVNDIMEMILKEYFSKH